MSKSIHSPGIVKVEEHEDSSATFSIEPLHSGYGMTLGNSLRRVLLSSISGAAVTAFKIDGASHEFTTLPHIKEDVVEIVLNLKGVRFKVFSEETQTLRLSKKGKGVIKAKDIALNADVEITNPDHIIATLDDPKGKLDMDILVNTGRGYHPIDESARDKLVADMISIDAMYSPVTRVRYKVENTRVGQMTDLDRLLISIETDGTLTPKDAFEEASAILVNQYTALAGQTRVEQGAGFGQETTEDGGAEGGDESPALMTPIEDLNLSARTSNALVNNDIHTLKDLVSLSDAELRDLKGFGNKALDEVKEKIEEMEL